MALRGTQVCKAHVRVDAQTQLREQGFRTLPQHTAIHSPPFAEARLAGKDVLCDRELTQHLDLLRDVTHSFASRVRGGVELNFLAIEIQAAGVAADRMHPIQDLDESGLAGPVLTQQRVSLSAPDREVYFV